MRDRRPFTITCVRRHPENGYWTARVTVEGETVEVHRRFPAWMADVRPYPRARHTVLREVLPHVAVELQAKVRREERKGR